MLTCPVRPPRVRHASAAGRPRACGASARGLPWPRSCCGSAVHAWRSQCVSAAWSRRRRSGVCVCMATVILPWGCSEGQQGCSWPQRAIMVVVLAEVCPGGRRMRVALVGLATSGKVGSGGHTPASGAATTRRVLLHPFGCGGPADRVCI